MSIDKIEISVVVPVYGCPNAIPELHRRLVSTLNEMNIMYEIILVDDCDGMGSWDEIEKVAKQDKNVKAIKLTKNYGQGRAITAGINEATGRWIITMDCDLQDLPEEIPTLYSKVTEGYDIVFVRRQNRKDSFIVQSLSKLFHRIFSYLSDLDFDYEIGTYLIASKRSADLFRESKDRGRDFSMFLMWIGLRSTFLEMEHDYRYDGKSSYTFKKKWNYAIGVMTTFSNRILYVPIHIGLISALGAAIYMIYLLIMHFMGAVNPEGWTSIIALILFFGGLILCTLGIVGVYIGNIFDMSKSRPLYVIQEKINCEGQKNRS